MHGGGMGGSGFHGSGIFHGGSGFGRGGFHAAGFRGGGFRGAARGFRAGRDRRQLTGIFRSPLGGTSRSAKGMAANGQRTRPEVVQCFTSDCSLWHRYRD
jgi:hypothetical protein